MKDGPLSLVFLGLSITSSWGNGHATTYRGLVRELAARGHDILFLERDVPWYAPHRDLPEPPGCRLALYGSLGELQDCYGEEIAAADAVIVGSYVPEGIAVGEWVTKATEGTRAFYDIDTPVTLAALVRGDCEYLSPQLVPRYDIYFSFTGGPTLDRLENEFGSPCARPLYCSVDPAQYHPLEIETRWDLGYLGTYSTDRQSGLERLLLNPARALPETAFIVAGPQFPADISWPKNVMRIEHLPPAQHGRFYNEQRFTLNLTRADMIAAGWSPSVRLFEAAACGTPIISDYWEGLEEFFTPNEEILFARDAAEVVEILRDLPEARRLEIGANARRRVLGAHTSAQRAVEFETELRAALEARLAPLA